MCLDMDRQPLGPTASSCAYLSPHVRPKIRSTCAKPAPQSASVVRTDFEIDGKNGLVVERLKQSKKGRADYCSSFMKLDSQTKVELEYVLSVSAVVGRGMTLGLTSVCLFCRKESSLLPSGPTLVARCSDHTNHRLIGTYFERPTLPGLEL
jgi:hypothetical protein